MILIKILRYWKNNYYKRLFVLFSFFLSLHSLSQNSGRETSNITPFIQALAKFSENIPQEKVYLHFDNTSYYQGDNIWFKCYVVTSGLNQLSPLSKTLYVELLSPGGEIVDKRVLKIENGQCHGDFTLNHLPFHSGFYEVRAYTKYMLNFGEDVIFSRLLPIFDKPKVEGNFEEREMIRYGGTSRTTDHYIIKREKPFTGNKFNLLFFPEGGNLIQGIPSRIAFEATDEIGNPIDIKGVALDNENRELSRFSTLHEGRGVFTYTPAGGDNRKDIAEVEYSGKKYRFNLPSAMPQGIAMEVDNLSQPDSIGITLRKNSRTSFGTLGLVVLTGGALQSYACINFTDEKNEICFAIDKTEIPTGVSQIVLFNNRGEILCDRLAFTGKNDFGDIKVKPNKPSYKPFELVEMEFSVTDRQANPINAPFSLSVRDGANEVENNHNILTDLLLMSEIKGYVRNPSYYFEADDETHRRALDVLLMVQGWRRYSWKQMTGLEPFEQKYRAEQGIETNGTIVSYPNPFFSNKQVPKPKVDVELLLLKRGKTGEDDEAGGIFFNKFVTDSKGRFSFVSDVAGKWNMTLKTSEKGKEKGYMILLDRVFSPKPKRYQYVDLQVSIAEKNTKILADNEETSGDAEEDNEPASLAYQDSLAKLRIDEKTHLLKEVTIKAKKNYREQEIFFNRSTSLAYYDIATEFDNIYDKGNNIGNYIEKVLLNIMNQDFTRGANGGADGGTNEGTNGGEDNLQYKGGKPLFVINYNKPGTDDCPVINVSAIKSIYISESLSAFCQYKEIKKDGPSCHDLFPKSYSCVVFIETYPEGEIPAAAAKGVRKTWLEGYSEVKKEFYSPDYSVLPPEPDYRRTLYWNPSVTTDETGRAKIRFYNNSNCKNFSISAETATSQGMIGVYKTASSKQMFLNNN